MQLMHGLKRIGLDCGGPQFDAQLLLLQETLLTMLQSTQLYKWAVMTGDANCSAHMKTNLPVVVDVAILGKINHLHY